MFFRKISKFGTELVTVGGADSATRLGMWGCGDAGGAGAGAEDGDAAAPGASPTERSLSRQGAKAELSRRMH